ncbi:ferrochelatase [Acidicapsa dinghuensis]|uniref:Ferrochelatase n=1 Tax=Acidicapsa dinghuensis TaxID=2218256 RepID=A0ABW1E9Y5_9BACT|nr:ferrochelatase [Acidicapsa dinghuensis]
MPRVGGTGGFSVKRAVLLLAHGTPETVAEIPEYLRNVVSGRPMPQHVVGEIQHRYSLIGEPKGHSPLTDLSMEQAQLLEMELAKSDEPLKVYLGMRNWRPYIADVVKQMRADGVEEAAVICLAPQNSRTSVGLYRRAVLAEAGGMRIDFLEGWADEPLLADAFAERLRTAYAKLKAQVDGPVPVLFTAHSVPTRTVQPQEAQEGQPKMWPAAAGPDPYADDARRTAEVVAERVPEIEHWVFAFQSQGASGGPWIGPTVEETLTGLAADGVKAVLLQPVGFLCDHVEILYDIDIAFREYAAGKGIRLERPESLNGSPLLTKALEKLARQGLERLVHQD